MHHSNITRRRAIGAAAAAGLAACGRERKTFPVTNVSVVKAPAYSMSIYDTVLRLVREHNPNVRGKRVVLKPNLVEFDGHTAINTHPMVVHAVYEAFVKLGAAQVRLAEGPGHRRGTMDLADAAGYFSQFRNFEALFTDLNTDSVTRRVLRNSISKLDALHLPNTVLDCDLLVSLPKMKTHHWAGATLAMKNLFGLVPGAVYGWPKNVLHWAGIPQSIVDLHHLFPNQFALVDGIVGMEGNGPIQGTPKHAGVLVAGRDVAAVDATCCRIMGIDPRDVEYLTLARGEENVAEASFRQVGERIDSVRSNFELMEVWRHARLQI